jgi:hypothetical protein
MYMYKEQLVESFIILVYKVALLGISFQMFRNKVVVPF